MAVKTIRITSVRFPDIQLATRDAHKLRGFFGNVFKSHSPLLHNHMQDGSLRYDYPLVQYKVLNRAPTLIGIGEGAGLMAELFLRMDHIDIDGVEYPVFSKNVRSEEVQIGIAAHLRRYSFQTLWLPLNQDNFRRYRQGSSAQRSDLLVRILTGNILSFLKAMDLWVEERILSLPEVQARETKFKDRSMLAFEGGFTANVELPQDIGIGRSVARGFGTILPV